jgi:hypothetical protein
MSCSEVEQFFDDGGVDRHRSPQRPGLPELNPMPPESPGDRRYRRDDRHLCFGFGHYPVHLKN